MRAVGSTPSLSHPCGQNVAARTLTGRRTPADRPGREAALPGGPRRTGRGPARPGLPALRSCAPSAGPFRSAGRCVQNDRVTDSPPPPLLRVVRGEPTAAELAALVAVLAGRSTATAPAPRVRSAWSDPARRLGIAGRAGPASWRRSALPS